MGIRAWGLKPLLEFLVWPEQCQQKKPSIPAPYHPEAEPEIRLNTNSPIKLIRIYLCIIYIHIYIYMIYNIIYI